MNDKQFNRLPKYAQEEITRLREADKELQGWTEIAEMNIKKTDDGMVAEVRANFARAFMTLMAGWFYDCKAINYVEVKAFHPDTGHLVFTMQRAEGETPHELRQKAEGLINVLALPLSSFDISALSDETDTYPLYDRGGALITLGDVRRAKRAIELFDAREASSAAD